MSQKLPNSPPAHARQRCDIKSAAGQCKLRVVETETRDAIVTDVPAAVNGRPHNSRTIAYLAIGAESWGPLLAAAPELFEALRELLATKELHDQLEILRPLDPLREEEYRKRRVAAWNAARVAIAKAELA